VQNNNAHICNTLSFGYKLFKYKVNFGNISGKQLPEVESSEVAEFKDK
jgi:hypothetical protein